MFSKLLLSLRGDVCRGDDSFGVTDAEACGEKVFWWGRAATKVTIG